MQTRTSDKTGRDPNARIIVYQNRGTLYRQNSDENRARSTVTAQTITQTIQSCTTQVDTLTEALVWRKMQLGVEHASCQFDDGAEFGRWNA
jgi:hypothetical protein